MLKTDVFHQVSIEPRQEAGAPMLLFDRLIEDSESEEPLKKHYNRFELIQSIEREVNRLLNTRSTIKQDLFKELSEKEENFGLPGMFGLPDFSQYDGTNSAHWPKIAALCKKAIEIYEPRLQNIHVKMTGFDRQIHALSATIQADLRLKEMQGSVTFPVAVSTV